MNLKVGGDNSAANAILTKETVNGKNYKLHRLLDTN